MISVIVPVYNEEKTLAKALDSLKGYQNTEVVIVDGGSLDKTKEILQEYPVKKVYTQKNRAQQLNAGAGVAQGRILLFLHADCRPEEGSQDAIRACIDKGYVGGCLKQRIDQSKIIYRLIESSGNIRAKLSKTFYGDQAIFVRRDVFFKVGGFGKMELFDDVVFSRKIRREGKTCVLDKKVYSSARRWEKQGIVKTTIKNWLLSLGFHLGVSPRILKKLYSEIR